jgi:hypothetical protein
MINDKVSVWLNAFVIAGGAYTLVSSFLPADRPLGVKRSSYRFITRYWGRKLAKKESMTGLIAMTAV